MAKKPKFETVEFKKITPGGQALGELNSGKKIFAWGVLPNETAIVQILKNKSNFAEGVATEIINRSSKRVDPQDNDSYLSTSPWQIFDFELEQQTKQALIAESFAQEKLEIKQDELFSDGKIFNYRNKIEFSFWFEKPDDEAMEDVGQLKLAFFRRGGRGKIPVSETSLARPEINLAANRVLKILNQRKTSSRDLKTLLIRANQKAEIAAQLYVKDENFTIFSPQEADQLNFKNFEIIFSDPKSPASVITKKLQSTTNQVLSDEILGVNFNYATEGFFQINLPVYEQALLDMKKFINPNKPTVDLYSGVGSIGLTIGKNNLTMVEINPSAVAEMKQNIKNLGLSNQAQAILAASENALNYIERGANLIVDPPRAGMDKKVCQKILEVEPQIIIYLSCNPTTQARDAKILSQKYKIIYSRGYNFFPRTPHIENLIVLEKI